MIDIGDVAAIIAAIVALAAFIRSGRRDEGSKQDAAEAKRLAEKANGVAEQHLEASVYPFVHSLPIQVGGTWSGYVTNSGAGPAIDIEVSGSIAENLDERQRDQAQTVMKELGRLNGTTMGPGQSVSICTHHHSMDLVQIDVLAYTNAFGRRYTYEGTMSALRPKIEAP